MPKLLVFQHVAYEILGNLNPRLRDAGHRIRYVNFGRDADARPSLSGYHGLVVLGGPMNCDEGDRYPHLDTEIEVIREAVDRDLPVLGICLGAQLLARALGAGVRRNPAKEIGWYDVSPTEAGAADPVIGHIAPRTPIFQWHGDTFDIPQGAVHLAESDLCTNQAFRYGDRAYGFQFHLEVDKPMIERWLQVPHHVAEIEGEGGRIDPDRIRGETDTLIGPSEALAARVFGAFIDLVGTPDRRAHLPSR